MTHVKTKIAVAGLILASAVGYLAYAGMDKGWVYTLSVDHFLQKPAAEQQRTRVRLCGTVEPTDFQAVKGRLGAKFVLKGETATIPVSYTGIVPEMFKAGAEVLVEGKRDASGVFQSDVMLTKCASKYEEAPNGHPVKTKPTTQEAEAKP